MPGAGAADIRMNMFDYGTEDNFGHGRGRGRGRGRGHRRGRGRV